MLRSDRLPLVLAFAIASWAAGCSSPRGGLLEGFADQLHASAGDESRSEPATVLAARLAEGSEGSEDAARDALQRAELLAREHPGPRSDALLGAARLLEARFATNPFAKLSGARVGLELLDRSVGADPEDWGNRYLRATSCFPLPDFLRRGATVRSDLESLLARIDSEDPFATPRRRALILLQSGILRREDGAAADAAALFDRAAKLAPDTAPGRRARWELEHSRETDE